MLSMNVSEKMHFEFKIGNPWEKFLGAVGDKPLSENIVKVKDAVSRGMIVIAADEDFMGIWQVAKPLKEVKSFPLTPSHGEVTRMNKNITRRQILKPTMTPMSIWYMYNFHDWRNSYRKNNR